MIDPLPPDLNIALDENPGAQAVWDGLTASHRREYVSWIAEAKTSGTRARRISETIAMLTGGRG